MEENVRKTDELSLLDILKLFWRHIKLLILVLLGGVIVGGSIGAISKYNVNYYGTNLTFYVNPYIDEQAEEEGSTESKDSQYGVYGAYGKHVMDNMVKLLSSELFSEILIQDVPNLPEKFVDGKMNPQYENLLMAVQRSVTFSYYGDDEEVSDVDSLARSFIYVNISVLNSESLAQYLMESVLDEVPAFVEENMTVPADYEGTNCQRITRTDEIARTNPLHRSKQAIKYGIFAAAAALVIACVIIVIVDKSDKRLRDTEIITKKFNVPVLGIVPSIEELTEDSLTKKAGKISNKEAK